jgi:hypothetical protein
MKIVKQIFSVVNMCLLLSLVNISAYSPSIRFNSVRNDSGCEHMLRIYSSHQLGYENLIVPAHSKKQLYTTVGCETSENCINSFMTLDDDNSIEITPTIKVKCPHLNYTSYIFLLDQDEICIDKYSGIGLCESLCYQRANVFCSVDVFRQCFTIVIREDLSIKLEELKN